MLKYIFISVLLLIGVLFPTGPVTAQTPTDILREGFSSQSDFANNVGGSNLGTTTQESSQDINSEAIRSFHSDIVVNTDNSITVSETILYDSVDVEKHGIFRDVRLTSSEGKKMEVIVLSVVDEKGQPYMYTESSDNDLVRIKIGDPEVTFKGQKTYIIIYTASKAVAHLDTVDEIYWNVTGNEWPVPILQVDATVRLPPGATLIQSACYYGPGGSTAKCQEAELAGNEYRFTSPASLNTGNGLTVAVGFNKGIVAPYGISDTIIDYVRKYLAIFLGILFPLLTLIFSLRYWYRHGRDPKGTGIIVPQYDTSDDLSPIEVSGIVNEKISTEDISAEIIFLATKGYLKIHQFEKTGFLVSTFDYEFIKLKDENDLPKEYHKMLMKGLFQSGDKVTLSSLDQKFYRIPQEVVAFATSGLAAGGYYKNLSYLKRGPIDRTRLLFLAPISLILGLILSFFDDAPFLILPFFGIDINLVPAMLGVLLSIVIFGMVTHFNPAKTEKGVATKEYYLGLKDYLQIAEKDRIQFHNAPEKKPEVFEKLLPYAMVLGVTSIWAKEFEGIYSVPPIWYEGSQGTAFNSMVFVSSLDDFNSSASSSLNSAPSSSSRGGSSGGGGGGGGSW